MNARLAFFCQTFYPDSISTSQLFSELLFGMGRAGREIAVYCGYPARSDTPLPAAETRDGVAIHRLGLALALKKSLAHRALAYASYLGQSFLKLLTLKKTEKVFGVTNPPFLLILLYLASLVRGFAYQYMLLDIYPEGLAKVDMLAEKSPLYRVWAWLNGLGYRRAEKIVVLGRDMIPLLTGKYRVDPTKIVYIPHWSPGLESDPPDFADNPMAAELGLKDAFVVQYSGNMGLWHDMQTLVKAAALLGDHPRVRFLFIGDGRRKAQAQALAAELALTNITWLDYQPKEKLPVSLTCCHAALISLRQGCEGVAVPCKLYGIMASGRAILAQVPLDSEVAMAVTESGCGLVAAPGDAAALARAIAVLAGDPDRARDMGVKALAAYRDLYTIAQAKRAFAALWDGPGNPADRP